MVPGLTVYFAFVGGFLGIPGAIGWLLIVASLPPEWSTLRRRAVALALSPLIQVTLLVFFFSSGYLWAAAMVGLLLPAGSAFVIRLRVRTPSALWRPEDRRPVSYSWSGTRQNSKWWPSGIRKSPPQLKPQLSKIRTISRFIVGFVP